MTPALTMHQKPAPSVLARVKLSVLDITKVVSCELKLPCDGEQLPIYKS